MSLTSSSAFKPVVFELPSRLASTYLHHLESLLSLLDSCGQCGLRLNIASKLYIEDRKFARFAGYGHPLPTRRHSNSCHLDGACFDFSQWKHSQK